MARMAAGVRKRADGTLEKRFTINGKRYSVYGKTNKELAEKELDLREKIKAGLYVGNQSITLNAYFEYWLLEKAKHIKENTIRLYKWMYEQHIADTLGSKKVQAMEKREIVELQNKLIDNGVSINSVNYAISTVLAMILADAVKDNVISISPASSVRKIKTEKSNARETIHRALTEDEQRLFMEETRNEYYYEFYAFLLCTGLRSGEAAALCWSDVDLINNVIHITKTVTYDRNDKPTIGTPKSKAGTRDIPLTDTAKNVLRLAKQKQILLSGSNIIPIDSRIFVNSIGGIVLNSTVNQGINTALKHLEEKGHNIDHFSVHCLRDTYATRAIEQGMQPQTLKAILGHSTLSMTMDLYAHVLPNTKQAEVDRLIIDIAL